MKDVGITAIVLGNLIFHIHWWMGLIAVLATFVSFVSLTGYDWSSLRYVGARSAIFAPVRVLISGAPLR